MIPLKRAGAIAAAVLLAATLAGCVELEARLKCGDDGASDYDPHPVCNGPERRPWGVGTQRRGDQVAASAQTLTP